MAKIIFEEQKCIGCGSCQAVCPKHWQLKDDGKAELLGSSREGDKFELEVEKVECSQEAADICPVQCIQVKK